ncbi:MAG TPA: alpha/beta fold hydrolase [Tepidisphaeraceae bacterium]|jgi:pimeloyl-ACP methyl ester carboxylesterase|nr:alpha/beta fold hydrolase [Tepidisphaeraceae bacterium]
MKHHPLAIFLFVAIIALLLCPSAPADEKSDAEQQRAILAAVENRILYAPRAYEAGVVDDFIRHGGKRIDYKTSQGAQSAWLIVPAKNARAEKLWVVCGGNATLALELEPFCRALPFHADAFLMVDYPGYGECAGSPSPATLRENLKQSILAAGKLTGIDPEKQPQRLCVFGHSLGCAAALLAVQEFHIRAAVLCAPFTSTLEMAQAILGIRANFQLQNKYDNRQGLAELRRNHGHAWIFHGDADEVIPVTMSQTLGEEFKGTATVKIIPGAHHNDILSAAGNDLIAAMAAARK